MELNFKIITSPEYPIFKLNNKVEELVDEISSLLSN